VPVSKGQLAEFADKHAWQIPFDTSPRHLAGPGDARHVTHGLAAAGWTRASSPLNTHLVLASPDRQHRLEFTPQTASLSRWWRVSTVAFGSSEYWDASFGALVPAEVIAGMTDALLATPPEQPDPWQAVDAAGWARDEDTRTARSDDGLCVIEHRPFNAFHDEPDWFIETTEPGYGVDPGRSIWQARLHANTPAHLVNAFIAALTDTAPLQRGRLDDPGHHTAVQVRSPLSPEQVVAAHTDRIKAITAQTARLARRRQRASTPEAPAHVSSTTRRR
jgi:hypothetical protein